MRFVLSFLLTVIILSYRSQNAIYCRLPSSILIIVLSNTDQEEGSLMLYDLIDHDLIDVVNHDIDAWEDAVKTTTRYLEQKGYVTANYADAIIQSTYDNGPYYVLCPGIAMPHARPEAGVIKTGLGIHIFPSAIEFGSDLGPANILLTLAAKDSDTHIEVIQALSEMLVDEENIAKLTAATSKNEVLDIIKAY